jgi:hypothetical protein
MRESCWEHIKKAWSQKQSILLTPGVLSDFAYSISQLIEPTLSQKFHTMADQGPAKRPWLMKFLNGAIDGHRDLKSSQKSPAMSDQGAAKRPRLMGGFNDVIHGHRELKSSQKDPAMVSQHSMADQDGAKRLDRLTKFFNGVIHGHRELKSSADGCRFLESLHAQEDVTKCVECLVAARSGIHAVAQAFRFSDDNAFLNGLASSVLLRLSDTLLKHLHSGQFLHRILEAIVEPPTFWNSFVKAHHARVLDDRATQAFAWLLLEILSSQPGRLPDVRIVAEHVTSNESLINSPSLDVRTLGQKIKHVLTSTCSNSEEGPGGRHDNDFADYRKIKLLPTADEFASHEQPFYRRGDAVDSVETQRKSLFHLDNQFRLLREELLGALRDDFQIAIGKKRGKRKLILCDLEFNGVDCGWNNRRQPCSVKLQCNSDIPQLANLKNTTARRNFIRENKNVLKHQSFGCLINGEDIVAFANVERNEDLLAQQPPVIVLRIGEHQSFNKVLLISKFSSNLQFVQVDTAFFAYEPILKCLQTMREIPLQAQLLDLFPGSNESLSGIEPTDVVNNIRSNSNSDLRSILGTDKSVELDTAQVESLVAGLTKKVSVIQGPPGKY